MNINLLSQLVADKELSNIDHAIDNLITSLPKSSKYSYDDDVEDTTGKVIDSFVNQFSNDDVSKLFQSVSIPAERMARYDLYDEMVKSVPLVKRILRVYKSNILPKNPVTGTSILYKEVKKEQDDEDKYLKSKKFAEEFVEQFNIIKKLKDFIIPFQLKYGDYFVEIVDINKASKHLDLNNSSPSSTFTSSLLTEQNIKKHISELNNINDNTLYETLDFHLQKFVDNAIIYEDSLMSLDVEDPDKSNKDQKQTEDNTSIYNFENILLKMHKPHNILILNTKYGTRIGYLEVYQNATNSSLGVEQSLSTVVSKITNLSRKRNINDNQLVDKLVFYAVRKILNMSKKNNPHLENVTDINELLKSLDEDTFKFIKRMFVEQDLLNKNKSHFSPMKIRFIPPSKMTQFNINSGEDYLPYSESIIEALVLPGKLYMLSQLSNAVNKLSRASLIRKWTLDVGSSELHGQMIQKLKRELYNTRITLNDLNSFKSIPKLLSDYLNSHLLRVILEVKLREFRGSLNKLFF